MVANIIIHFRIVRIRLKIGFSTCRRRRRRRGSRITRFIIYLYAYILFFLHLHYVQSSFGLCRVDAFPEEKRQWSWPPTAAHPNGQTLIHRGCCCTEYVQLTFSLLFPIRCFFSLSLAHLLLSVLISTDSQPTWCGSELLRLLLTNSRVIIFKSWVCVCMCVRVRVWI